MNFLEIHQTKFNKKLRKNDRFVKGGINVSFRICTVYLYYCSMNSPIQQWVDINFEICIIFIYMITIFKIFLKFLRIIVWKDYLTVSASIIEKSRYPFIYKNPPSKRTSSHSVTLLYLLRNQVCVSKSRKPLSSWWLVEISLWILKSLLFNKHVADFFRHEMGQL